jgi:hypothetical protein
MMTPLTLAPLLCFSCTVALPLSFLCVLLSKLPLCYSVDWDCLPKHGLCPRPNCEVDITMPPPGTAEGYKLVERHGR